MIKFNDSAFYFWLRTITTKGHRLNQEINYRIALFAGILEERCGIGKTGYHHHYG